MDVQVQAVTLAALLLGVARAAGFVLIAPPFSGTGLPTTVRATVALALSLVMMPHVQPDIDKVTAGFLVTATATEVAIGAALGLLVQVLFSAVKVAGDIIDITGGFSLQPAFDPMAMTMHGTIGRLHHILSITLLFTSGGHLLMVSGFAKSYAALPVGDPVPTENMASMLITAFAMMFLAAAQIAGPLVAVLLLSDVALALLNRAAPALNMFSIGFPVKILITVTLLGLTFPLLPPALASLLKHAAQAMVSLGGGG